jgi:hypothetical protein
MKRFLLLALICGLAATALAAPRLAATQSKLSRFDDWLFQVPAGWRAELLAGGLSLFSPDAKAAVILFPGQAVSGDFRAWFDGRIAQLHANGTVIQAGDVQSRTVENYTVHLTGAVLRDAKDKTTFRLYFAANPASRGELMMYLAQDMDSFQKHQAEFTTLVQGVAFAQLKPELAATATVLGQPGTKTDPPVTGTPDPSTGTSGTKTSGKSPDSAWVTAPGKGLKADQIDGVYFKLEAGIGAGGMVTQEYNPYLFLKDGWVYNDPDEAPSDFDAAASKRLEPKNWGRWQRSGNNVTIIWNAKPNKPSTYEQKQFLRAIPGKPSLKLEGQYQSISGGGNTALGGTSMVTAWKDFEFKRDGRFLGAGGAGSSGSEGGTSVTVGVNSPSTVGTYSFDGHTVQLKYDDGRVQRSFFCLFPPDDGSTKVLMIAGSTYIRK